MASERVRVTAYLPVEIAETLQKFKEQNEIEGDSATLIEVLKRYLLPDVNLCRGCRLWEEDEYSQANTGSSNAGFCHRYPQREVKYSDDWCGEFKPKQSL